MHQQTDLGRKRSFGADDTVVTETGFRFPHFGYFQRTDALIGAYPSDIM
jgi:hypothetical protein